MPLDPFKYARAHYQVVISSNTWCANSNTAKSKWIMKGNKTTVLTFAEKCKVLSFSLSLSNCCNLFLVFYTLFNFISLFGGTKMVSAKVLSCFRVYWRQTGKVTLTPSKLTLKDGTNFVKTIFFCFSSSALLSHMSWTWTLRKVNLKNKYETV